MNSFGGSLSGLRYHSNTKYDEDCREMHSFPVTLIPTTVKAKGGIIVKFGQDASLVLWFSIDTPCDFGLDKSGILDFILKGLHEIGGFKVEQRTGSNRKSYLIYKLLTLPNEGPLNWRRLHGFGTMFQGPPLGC